MKVESTKIATVGTCQAQVIFLNTKHKKTRSEINEKPKNDFISDGGLREKTLKYYNSSVFNKSSLPKSKI
jgi:hypothetical protein